MWPPQCQYAELVKRYYWNDGKIDDVERKMLDREAVKLMLLEDEAQKIEEKILSEKCPSFFYRLFF